MTGRPVDWADIASGAADELDGRSVEIEGAVQPVAGDYALLAPGSPCCIGCGPGDRQTTIEVLFDAPVEPPVEPMRVAGVWKRLPDDDPAGWRCQLRQARIAGTVAPGPAGVFSRRAFLGAAALFCTNIAASRDARAATETELDEVHREHGLRHLQLTRFRINELGDI